MDNRISKGDLERLGEIRNILKNHAQAQWEWRKKQGIDTHMNYETTEQATQAIKQLLIKARLADIDFACMWFYQLQQKGKLGGYYLEDFQRAPKEIVKALQTKIRGK